MELQHVNVKIFVDGELSIDLERLIEVFHTWTAEQSMPEMMIDVADYRHVPAGPGVILVGHEADYALDQACNRSGLLYNRKAAVEGTNQDRFRQALHAASDACLRLEAQLGDELSFSRQELQLLINDRALAPNSDATRDACIPEIQSFFADVLGHDQFEIEPESDTRRRFGVQITSKNPWDLASF